jgi:hypothetical protein
MEDQEEGYIGCVDGRVEHSRVVRPLTSRDEAVASDESYVEGA